jgi:cytochrome c oxidase assembly protein subunit 15
LKGGNNLHRFALFTAVATFFLIIAGGLVTSTGSALSVPDWPLSYGQLMPPMVGGILYEHGHRMVASFVGFLTVILSIWLWRSDNPRWVRTLGWFALGAVIAQGVLGGLTVLYLLPTPISVAHATLGQTFFSLVAAIALFTSSWWRSNEPKLVNESHGANITTLCIITAVAVYIQLILGALMRHTDSGLAVPDFPLAYGQLFPSLTPDALARYNDQLLQSDIRIAADGPITASQILIHMLHRCWAVVVTVMILWTSIRLAKLSKQASRLSRFGFVLPILLIIQITLGAFTVLTLKSVGITTAHVATGALILVTCVLASLHSVKIYGFEFRRAFVMHAQEATA